MRPILLLLFAILAGCATVDISEVINQDYQTIVFNDGISLEEAIIIAKKEVLDKTPSESYLLEEPKVMTDFETVPHQEKYWFVAFNETQKTSVPILYMVAIQKVTGKIVFSRSYAAENEWVLQAAFLKLHEIPK